MSGKWRGEPSREIASPVPGYFRVRLVKNGWEVPARLALADDAWTVTVDGTAGPTSTDPETAGVWRVWTTGRRIEQWEYDYLLALKPWAAAHEPNHPCLSPRSPISPNRLSPIPPRR